MTARTFTGLIIGGPMAGTWLTHNDPVYKLAERASMDFREIMKPIDPTENVKVFTYKHLIGFIWKENGRWTQDAMNFWIPGDKDWSPIDCVRMMAEDYANYHDLRNS